jgi:hypothetical protein
MIDVTLGLLWCQGEEIRTGLPPSRIRPRGLSVARKLIRVACSTTGFEVLVIANRRHQSRCGGSRLSTVTPRT